VERERVAKENSVSESLRLDLYANSGIFNCMKLDATLLASPVRMGDFQLKNRVVMAPLTRCRAPGRVANALMAEYYRQRAGAGLILSEGAVVMEKGVGYPDTPGLWSREQVEAWKPVTRAVHEGGSLIAAQLWHCGRVSDPSLLGGELPVAPSAVALEGHVSLLRPLRPYPVPRPLREDEIPGIVEGFRRGAQNALEAGFDGAELHSANGYLLNEFLDASANLRTDRYGGSFENRARLLLEVADAVASVFGPGRVGVHLSPITTRHGMLGTDARELYPYVARELGKRKLAFLFIREKPEVTERITPVMKREFGGAIIANDELTPEAALRHLAAGECDAVSWGRPFISNPDLVERLVKGAPLAPPDDATLYGVASSGDPRKGYTDYPRLG
jgi:2,4-dienoyl-CoA reductase-like NADH-dependent reductase (Old Yellow Enzyme family)